MRNKTPLQNLLVRRLHAGDGHDIRDHFLRLDVQSRRARFCGAIGDTGVSNYAGSVLGLGSVVCGAFVDEQLVGLVELRGLFRSWPSTAEAAFSVEPKWQDNGIGDALFERMFAIARNRGVRTVRIICLKDNRRMQHLALKHNARLWANQDQVEAVLRTKWPTPRSILLEFLSEIRGYSNVY